MIRQLPTCEHRGAELDEQCFCRRFTKPGVPVYHDRCFGCPDNDSNQNPATISPACPHRQAPIASIVSTCKSTHRHHVYGCAIHGRCVLTLSQAQDVHLPSSFRGQNTSVRYCHQCPDAPQPPPPRAVDVSRLAIITTHFNPNRYNLPIRNYWEWRHHLGPLAAQLYTIELSFDGHFTIPDAYHINGTARNLMWQKEALINAAVARLPSHYDTVAWIDHDLIFPDNTWAESAVAHLTHAYDVIQLFSAVEYRDAAGNIERTNPGAVRVHQHTAGVEGSPGGAWAARLDFFRSIGGLVSQNVVGGGDQVACDAFLGRLSDYWRRNCPKMRDLDRRWTATVQQHAPRVGFLPLTVRHLYHGSRAARQYVERMDILRRHDFDPDSDVRVDASGLLVWASDKPQLHQDTAHYFAARQEDT